MRSNSTRHALLVLTIPIAINLVGCGRQNPVLPVDDRAVTSDASLRLTPSAQLSPAAKFYPLTIGNRWHYGRVLWLRFAPGEDPSDTIRSEIDRELIDREVIFDREYILEAETIVQDSRPGEIFRSWIRYRQDHSGLYYADICGCEPPQQNDGPGWSATPERSAIPVPLELRPHRALTSEQLAVYQRLLQRLAMLREAVSAARDQSTGRSGGALPNEVALLQYPLRPGASWTLREDPLFVYTVEGLEMLNLPVGKQLGYRIRVDFGPEPDPTSQVHVWFGRAGMLGYRISFRVVGEGSPGYIEGEESQWLEEASLMGHAAKRAN